MLELSANLYVPTYVPTRIDCLHTLLLVSRLKFLSLVLRSLGTVLHVELFNKTWNERISIGAVCRPVLNAIETSRRVRCSLLVSRGTFAQEREKGLSIAVDYIFFTRTCTIVRVLSKRDIKWMCVRFSQARKQRASYTLSARMQDFRGVIASFDRCRVWTWSELANSAVFASPYESWKRFESRIHRPRTGLFVLT